MLRPYDYCLTLPAAESERPSIKVLRILCRSSFPSLEADINPHSVINRATRAVTVLSATALALALAPAASGQARPISVTGVHPSGATYAIEVPRNWNGTLLTFSPGYGQGAGPQHLPADLGGEPAARNWLLAHGYALAGTRPYGDGWAVAETLRGSADTLAEFADVAGTPATTLAWGGSMGGAVAAGLAERRPDLIDGALPYCASVAGPVAMLNQSLDAAFVFKTLLAPGDDAVKLVRLASAEEETRASRPPAPPWTPLSELRPGGPASPWPHPSPRSPPGR